MLSFKVETSGVNLSKLDLERSLQRLIDRLIEYAYGIMRFDETPERTGHLKGSIKRRKRELKGEISVGIPYAIYVEFGTVPHEIRPVRARALRFVTEAGEVVFTKLVRHPGTKPNPFIKRTMERTAKQLEKEWVKIWEAIK